MTLGITIGSADQSEAVGTLGIVMGDAAGGAVLDHTLPETTVGSVLLAAIVHDDPIYPGESAETWEIDPLADNQGAGDYRLTILKRTSDRTPGAVEGDRIRVFSPTEQEMVGCLVQAFGSRVGTVIEAVASGAFLDDAAPEAPIVECSHRRNTVLVVIAAAGQRTFTAPTGYTEEEDYFSTEFSDRSQGVFETVANAVGEIAPGRVTLSSASSGRIWSVVLKYEFLGSRHAARIRGPAITNPSRHARRT